MENNRTIQSKKTRYKIYDTSIKLFTKHGFESVTIKDITNAANVSVGSFYNYFKSKQDVLYDKYRIADQHFKEFVSEGIPGNNNKEKIQAYMLYYIEFVLTEPFDFTRILYTPSNTLFLKDNRLMQTLLNPILEDAKNMGEFASNLTIREINEYLFLSMRGLIFHWCLHNGSFDLLERARQYLPMIISSL